MDANPAALSPTAPIIPIARTPIVVRPATLNDLPFIDGLQKMHTHMVGWMPTKQLEGKIAAGHVLIAEGGDRPHSAVNGAEGHSPRSTFHARQSTSLGYVIGQDHYSGRDDVGIIYQMNVIPLQQRKLIGAVLLKAMFERAAYGCRLFCCWCAQDIQANYFWEALGFVPLAFRTGSRGKQRTHIFWQRRIRQNDTTTPYWYPSQTKAGLIREDRLVLPIPPGTCWRDAKPLVLPPLAGAPEGGLTDATTPKALPPTRPPVVSPARKMAIVRSQSKALLGLPPGKAAVLTAGGVRYVERADYVPEPEPIAVPKKPRPSAAKNDPRLVKAARELRDRYLEDYNRGRTALPPAKYDVGLLLNGAGHEAESLDAGEIRRALPDSAAA